MCVMESIGNLLKLPIKSKANSERAYIISILVEKLESDRLMNPYYFKGDTKVRIKPFTGRSVAIRVGHFKTNQELYDLLTSCKHGKSFMSTFNYLTKIVNV